MNQPEPIRTISVAPDLLVYVSDQGVVVLAQGEFDPSDPEATQDGCGIGIDARNVAEVIKAMQALQPIAAAKESAWLSASDAMYQAAVARGEAL